MIEANMAEDSMRNLNRAKTILRRHYPDPYATPRGLLTDLYKAIRDAETRGFEECLEYFSDPVGLDDNGGTK